MRPSIPTTREILFSVTRLSDGHRYVVYTDGNIEGFGEGTTVRNRYPLLLQSHLAQYERVADGVDQ